jgi:hypothetical protein
MNHKTKTTLTQKYDLLTEKFHDTYLAQKKRSRDAMETALEKSHQQLLNAEEYSVEQGQELMHYLKRDLDQTIIDMEKLEDSTKAKLNPSRLGAGALSSLASILDKADISLHTLKEKTKKHLCYKTGEVTSVGTLTCQSCDQKIHLKSIGHVPPCPKCKATVFSKSY